MKTAKKLAILVGGGPAPGINSVISAATIRAELEGVDVVGIRDGFEWIMQGNIDHVRPADDRRGQPHPLPRRLAHRHLARQPDQEPAAPREHRHLAAAPERVAAASRSAATTPRISAMKLEEKAGGRIRVVHVPKTIDNDLDLPPYVDTFGFQTARHYGVEIVKNLMVDARDDLALVLRHRDGTQGGPPRARHRQGGRRDADAHPRGVRRAGASA